MCGPFLITQDSLSGPGASGASRYLATDHHCCGRLSICCSFSAVLRDLRCVEQISLLSPSFESSIPDFYFSDFANNQGPFATTGFQNVRALCRFKSKGPSPCSMPRGRPIAQLDARLG